MKLNNKGFAITAVIYGLLILFVILVSSYLTVLSARKNRVDNLVKDIEEEYMENMPQSESNSGDNTGDNGDDEPENDLPQEITLYKVTLEGHGRQIIDTLYFSPEEAKCYLDEEREREITKITPPTLNGMTFKGYFTGTLGNGKPIIAEDGTIKSFNINTEMTLHSYWITNSGNGDVTA